MIREGRPKMKRKLNSKGVHVRSDSKGRISCAVKSMRKTCLGWGKKGVLFFFGLLYFRDVVQATKY